MQTQRCSRFLIAAVASVVAVTGTVRPALSSAHGSNLVYNVLGTVSVSRFSNVFSPASNGTRVSPKHQIQVAANSRVSLLCKNTTVHTLSTGVHRVEDYCGKEQTRRGGRNSARDPFDPSLPHLLSPRNTALLDGNIVISNKDKTLCRAVVSNNVI